MRKVVECELDDIKKVLTFIDKKALLRRVCIHAFNFCLLNSARSTKGNNIGDTQLFAVGVLVRQKF